MGYNIQEEAKNANTLDAVPEGRYTVVIDDAVVGKSSTNKDMIKLTMTITDGKYAKRKLWNNLILEGKAFKFAIDVLKAYNSALLSSSDVPAAQLAEDMKGKKVSVYTIPGVTTNGNPTNNVSQFKTVDAVDSNKKSLFG